MASEPLQYGGDRPGRLRRLGLGPEELRREYLAVLEAREALGIPLLLPLSSADARWLREELPHLDLPLLFGEGPYEFLHENDPVSDPALRVSERHQLETGTAPARQNFPPPLWEDVEGRQYAEASGSAARQLLGAARRLHAPPAPGAEHRLLWVLLPRKPPRDGGASSSSWREQVQFPHLEEIVALRPMAAPLRIVAVVRILDSWQPRGRTSGTVLVEWSSI